MKHLTFIGLVIFSNLVVAQDYSLIDTVKMKDYKNVEVVPEAGNNPELSEESYLISPNTFRIQFLKGSKCKLKVSGAGSSFTNDTLCSIKV